MSEAFVSAIIGNALSTANSQTAAASMAAREAITSSQGYSSISPVPITYTLTAIEPVAPEVENATLTYEAQRDKLIELLSDELAGFFIKYYPLASDAFDEATAWLVNAITVGGTGIAPAVEQQIWQRGRDRVLADGARTAAQTLDEFASRGFSLPPGAMAARLQEERFVQLGKIQDHSRDVTIKAAEMEIENLRFAVEQAINSRMKAMAAASDYIRGLMSGVDSAARVASINSDAKARMLSATSDLYRARLARDELAMKIPMVNSDTSVRVAMGNQEGFYKGVQARTDAAGNAAEVYGKTAMAALSSLSAIAGSSNSSFG